MKEVLKRVLGICLVVMCFAMAFGESMLDLSAYSDEEITALLEQVQNEVVTRGIEKTATLQRGRYVGGKDIPVGSYILYCKTDSDHYGIVWVSAADDDLDNEYPSQLYEFISTDEEETFRIDIEEGGQLDLPFEAQLQISGGVMFK